MKKIYTLGLCLFAALAVSAQVSVTFQVDVTNYSAETTIAEAGMRVGGTFSTLGGTVDGTDMVDWSPGDVSSAMTDDGDGIWSITVDFPEDQIGEQLLFKFVNGDWGTNEGGDGQGIASGSSDDCGVDDGDGNINRTMNIPSEDVVVQYCYDSCKTCNGGNPFVSINERMAAKLDLSVAPNPTQNATNFLYTIPTRETVNITIFNTVGAVVSNVVTATQDAGTYQVAADMSALDNGVYIYRMQVGNITTHGQLVKQ